MAKANRISQLVMNEASPEKAGVGGSIPSLATIPFYFKGVTNYRWSKVDVRDAGSHSRRNKHTALDNN